MDRPLLSPLNDYVFKRFFTDGPDGPRLLHHFLQSVRPMAEEEYAGMTIIDPAFRAHKAHDKLPILDIKLRTASDILIDLEVQQAFQHFFDKRLAYYTGRMYVDKLRSGDNYDKLRLAISIVVADFVLFKDRVRHHHFRMYDEQSRTAYPEFMEIHTLEIPKRGKGDISPLGLWMRFFAARTEEEFMSLAKIEPVMEQGWKVIRELSADEEARFLAEAQEKYRRDIDAYYQTGIIEGEARGEARGKTKERRDIAQGLLHLGLPLEQIATGTGLTVDQVRELRQQ